MLDSFFSFPKVTCVLLQPATRYRLLVFFFFWRGSDYHLHLQKYNICFWSIEGAQSFQVIVEKVSYLILYIFSSVVFCFHVSWFSFLLKNGNNLHITTKNTYILKCKYFWKTREWGKEERGRERHPVLTIAMAGSGWSQKSETPSAFSSWVAGTEVLEPSPAASLNVH